MPSDASLANLRPPWKPGQSGHGGKPVGSHHGYRRVLAESRRLSMEGLQTIVLCMRDATAPWPSRLRAAEVILDRAWGAADQRVTIDGGIGFLRVEFITGEQTPQQSSGKGNGHGAIIDVPFEEP